MLIYQYHNDVLGVMNSHDYEKMIELSEDDVYIVDTILTHQIPVLSFAIVFDTNYSYCYAGNVFDFIDYCVKTNIFLKDANKTHRGMYIPFSNGYEKYEITNKNSCQARLKLLEMKLLPTRKMFEGLGLTELWYTYHTRQKLEMGVT
jgi:hypothetical protein